MSETFQTSRPNSRKLRPELGRLQIGAGTLTQQSTCDGGYGRICREPR